MRSPKRLADSSSEPTARRRQPARRLRKIYSPASATATSPMKATGIGPHCPLIHSVTAKLYEDFGLLTADPDVTADVADLFNYLTGYSHQQAYRRILVAPITLRPRLLEMIRYEAEASDGRIVMKMNSLVDSEMIDALYEASQAGTEIDLIVRSRSKSLSDLRIRL